MNPGGKIKDRTKAQKRYESNTKHEAHTKYKLQDNQVYYKEYYDARLGEALLARYAVCDSDAFEIITTVHEKLMHAYKKLPF
jgi:hypothetical protein